MSIEKTCQSKKRVDDVMEQFSKEKAEDPLIRYWIERKKEKSQDKHVAHKPKVASK